MTLLLCVSRFPARLPRIKFFDLKAPYYSFNWGSAHFALLFAGHDHNYQHHLKNGVHYIVTGGGGAPLAPVDDPIPGITQKVEKVEHFVIVKVEGNRAQIDAIALDGHPIETVTLNP